MAFLTTLVALCASSCANITLGVLLAMPRALSWTVFSSRAQVLLPGGPIASTVVSPHWFECTFWPHRVSSFVCVRHLTKCYGSTLLGKPPTVPTAWLVCLSPRLNPISFAIPVTVLCPGHWSQVCLLHSHSSITLPTPTPVNLGCVPPHFCHASAPASEISPSCESR